MITSLKQKPSVSLQANLSGAPHWERPDLGGGYLFSAQSNLVWSELLTAGSGVCSAFAKANIQEAEGLKK